MALLQEKRFEAIRAARQEMETITVQSRVATALKHRAGLIPHPTDEFGDKLGVWRKEAQKYEGRYIVLSYDGRNTVNKIASFSTSVFNPVHTDDEEIPPTDDASIPPNMITNVPIFR